MLFWTYPNKFKARVKMNTLTECQNKPTTFNGIYQELANRKVKFRIFHTQLKFIMQGKIKLVTRRHQSTETAQAVTEMIKLADKAIK